ncbi:MAG: AIPR family protein [Candidatus Thermoplasmatota archaeon]|nr:AIPR family protein [Candidatus Thermoplasmatota archaeon]
MHRIVKAHLDSFVKSFGLEAEDEANQFEKFATHCVVASRFSSSFDIDDVTTSAADDGIDGVALVIDEAVCASLEDAQATFNTARRNHDVDVMFVQGKRSENFGLGDFLKFKEAILRFFTQTPYTVEDEVLLNARQIFDVVLQEVPKVRNGKPSLTVRFVTTGLYRQPHALETALTDFVTQLDELGLFADTDVKFIDRDELTELWVGTYSGINASLDLFSNAALPAIAGIDEAYLAVVKASDFVKNLLVTPDGNLRTQVFEENVRSFLGMDNPVNQSIAATLNSGAATRFPVLNNGITIVSPDIRLQGNTLHLTNFQIVNGCQTSNVLYENQEHLQDIMVNVKVVETQNEDVFSELVRATNSQSKVEDIQFISLRPIIKRVEQFFNTYEGNEGRLYFERRDRQYVGLDIPATRIYSVHSAAKCVTAMYCERPDLSARYPKRMYEELTETIFAEDTKELVFYAACLTMYRFTLLVSNSVIPQNMKRFKWHMLPVVRALICGKGVKPINSRQVEQSAQKIVDVMAQHGSAATDIFAKFVTICQSLGEVTADRLKRQAILAEMLAQVP